MTAPAPAPPPNAAAVRALEGRTTPAQPPPPPPGGPRPGERTLRLLTVAVVALCGALLTGHALLLALAAAPLVLLALALPRACPRRVETSTTVEPSRCFEGDTVTVRISVATTQTPSASTPASRSAPASGSTRSWWTRPR